MNYDDLTCPYRDKNINVFSQIEKIKNGYIMLQKRKEIKSELNEKGKNKQKEQKSVLYNIETLYQA